MAYLSNKKIRFVTVGYIEWRKGQDVLLEAIKLLSPEVRESSLFVFAGPDTSEMAAGIRDEIPDIPQIVMKGVLDRAQMKKLYEDADVLICPSREDPMPTVCAEAMAYGVPCIVSDVTGTAAYLSDGENGFVFPSEDVQMLAEKITYVVMHTDMLPAVGQNAKEIYRLFFSMSVFQEKLLTLVEQVI